MPKHRERQLNQHRLQDVIYYWRRLVNPFHHLAMSLVEAKMKNTFSLTPKATLKHYEIVCWVYFVQDAKSYDVVVVK